MLEKLKRVRPLTFVFLIAAVVALAIMVAKGWKPEEVATVAAALVAVASQMHRLLGPDPNDTKAPPGATILPFVIGLGFALCVAACASAHAQALEAEAAYGNEQVDCLADEPTLRSDAPLEQRRAAWARFDTCRATVRAKWGIVETVTAKDGGR